MAKMSYTKPAITFQAIPLVVGGGTGCSLSATSAEYICPVYDEDLEVTVFASSDCEYTPADGTATSAEYICPVYDEDLEVTVFASSDCEYTPADGTNICYTVPTADANIYNS